MATDTKAKFGFTVHITLDSNIEESSSGPVVSIPTTDVAFEATSGPVISLPTVDVSRVGVYGQTASFAVVNINGVYGQVTAISGIGLDTAADIDIGGGDIIYYGDVADINMMSGVFSATFENQVDMSGMAAQISPHDSITTQRSNSIIFSVNDTAILPAAEVGTYLLFSNHNGLNFSVSGVHPIVTSVGESNLVSISGVGSHLGLIGAGNKWIATEENGIA